MNYGRREFLAGTCVFVASTIGAGATSVGCREPLPLKATLFLHSAGLGQHSVATLLRADAGRDWSEHVVQVSAHGGFGAAGALLDRAKGQCLVALVNDSDELSIDRLLTMHGACDRTRHRADRFTLLLTARL